MNTKICNKCGKEWPTSNYHKASRNIGGLYHTCKTCRKDIDRTYYEVSDKKDKKLQRDRLLAIYFKNYKQEIGCKICGEKESCCLDFHHKNQNDKIFNIGLGKYRYGKKKLEEEISKCILVCSNCHRKIHAGIMAAPVD